MGYKFKVGDLVEIEERVLIDGSPNCGHIFSIDKQSQNVTIDLHCYIEGYTHDGNCNYDGNELMETKRIFSTHLIKIKNEFENEIF